MPGAASVPSVTDVTGALVPGCLRCGGCWGSGRCLGCRKCLWWREWPQGHTRQTGWVGSGRVRIFESGVVSCIRMVSQKNSQASMRVDTSGLGGWSVWRLKFFTAGKGFTVVVGVPPWVYSSSGFLSSGSGPTPCPEPLHCHQRILFTKWQEWLLLTHLHPWMLPKTE